MRHLELSGTAFLLSLLIVFTLLSLFIYLMRLYFSKKVKRTEPPAQNWNLRNRTKSTQADVFRHTDVFLKIGLFTSLLIVFFAFSWTSTSDQNHHFLDENYSPDLTVEQIPNTFQQEKPKPVIPKLIVELPEELIDEEPEEYFEPMDISVDQSVFDEGIRAEESNHTPPPLPPPVENDYDESPFYVVEVNPRFPGCEIKTLSNKEKEACAKKKLLEYVYQNLKYPAIARETGIEGTVIIQFVVSENGEILDVEILRDIGAGCGEAAAKVIENMNNLPERWEPGRQRGRPVKVLFTLPVKFKLMG